MAEYQTTVQDTGAILRGSGKLELSAVSDPASWTDVGAISGLKREEMLEVSSEENDNTDSEDVVTQQDVKISFNLHEPLRLAVHKLLRESLDTFTTVAAAPVAGATQTLVSGAWNYDHFYKIEHQNGDASEITINSVTGGIDGALTDENGYFKGQNEAGEWGIWLADDSSELTTEAQNIVIDYDYTPSASVKIQSGDKSTMQKFMVRITTANDSKTYYFVGYYCNITKGFNFEHPKDDDADRRVKMPVEIICKKLPSGAGGAAGNVGYVYETVQTDGF